MTEPSGRVFRRADQAILYVVMAANILFFSVIGGALLTRYLLPLYPLILLLCVSTFYRRVPYWWGLVLLSAAAFLIGLFVNPPYKFAPEDNLNYADVVRLHQQAIRQIVTHFPGSTVLTAWPATDELTKPELGYVKKPLAVVTVANFSLPEIQKAAASPQDFSVGFAFSTKYDPPRLLLDLGARNEAMDTRFFDFHRDLAPGAIAHLLDGRIVWRDDRQGEWAAVLHFNRPQVASLHTDAGYEQRTIIPGTVPPELYVGCSPGIQHFASAVYEGLNALASFPMRFPRAARQRRSKMLACVRFLLVCGRFRRPVG